MVYSTIAMCASPLAVRTLKRQTSVSLDTFLDTVDATTPPPPPPRSPSAAAIASSPSASPALLPQHKHKLSKWRLWQIKEELREAYGRVKHSGASLRRRLSLSPDTEAINVNGRSLKIEYMDNRQRPSFDAFVDELESPDHNYSASLQLTDLRDGCFTAELPLDALPTGHITIRIRNYKMEVIVGHRGSSGVDDDHCITHPVRYGDIDIPIYVNPESLAFEIDDARNRLHVTGFMKGCNGIQQSKKRTTEAPVSHERNRLLKADSLPQLAERHGSLSRRSLSVSNMPKGSIRSRSSSTSFG